MPRKPEKSKTDQEQKTETLEAREDAIVEVLTNFERGQKDLLEKDNDAVSKMPDGPKKKSRQTRIGLLQEDVEGSEESLKILSEERDINPCINFAEKIIARKIKNFKYAPRDYKFLNT